MTPAALLIALLGLVLAILGLGSALDVVSLRVLLAGAELWGAVGPVQALRATLEHGGAQGLELACGLAGLGLSVGAVCRLRGRGALRRRRRQVRLPSGRPAPDRGRARRA